MAFLRKCRRRIFIITALVVATTYVALEMLNPLAARDMDAIAHALKSLKRKSSLAPLVPKFSSGGNMKLDSTATDVNSTLKTLTFNKKSSLVPLVPNFSSRGNIKFDLTATDAKSTTKTFKFNRKSSLVPLVQQFSRRENPALDVTVSDVRSKETVRTVRTEEATNNPVPRNVSFYINVPTLCSEEPNLKYIIYVHTSPGNVAKREQIRNTWANKDLFADRRTKLMFLSGQTQSKNDMDALMYEVSKYKDIVIGNFVDDFQNLTVKAIMGLKWVTMFCQNADYAIKADDDAFVNIFEVMKIVESHQESERLVVCPLWKDNSMPILRDPKECRKWCVKHTEFSGQHYYPQYCAGLSYLLSRELVSQMYDKVRTTPFFWIDDVYVTGLLLGKLNNVQYVDLMNNFTVRHDIGFRQYANLSRPITYQYIHVPRPKRFPYIWQALLERTPIDILKVMNKAVFANFPKVKSRLLDSSTSVQSAT